MPRRPNIIVVLPHDLGQHLNCYGVTTVHSPHLDGLAARGVRFTRSFCASPSCSPSRAAIFTGRYPHSNGVMGLCHSYFAWDLHPGERHLAGLLHDAGYHTALIGNHHETRRVPEMGYDHVNGSWPFTHARATEIGDAVATHIRGRAGEEQPFFIQAGFFQPHRPFDWRDAQPDSSRGVTVPPWLVDEPSAREEFAAYQGAIRCMDDGVGRILAALDASGQRDDSRSIASRCVSGRGIRR
jgi:N-sulfoglucosamine sulfohydrolase